MKIKHIFGIATAVCAMIFPTVEASAQVLKSIGKGIVKKEAKQVEKSAAKKGLKSVEKKTVRSLGKDIARTTAKSSARGLSSSVAKSMTKEVAEIFSKGGYKEVKVAIRGANKPLLVSPKFDPYMKVPRIYTGDFDPVKFHAGNPRFVKDGCETNLGRMKRGLAPLYKDPSNKNVADHGYSAFELHHGGQKSDPKYFALMGEEHKTQSAILHPVRKGSEINRNEFSKKERTPLYKDLAECIDYLL